MLRKIVKIISDLFKRLFQATIVILPGICAGAVLTAYMLGHLYIIPVTGITAIIQTICMIILALISIITAIILFSIGDIISGMLFLLSLIPFVIYYAFGSLLAAGLTTPIIMLLLVALTIEHIEPTNNNCEL